MHKRSASNPAHFPENFRGPLIGRDHPEFDEARKVYNGMIDKRPLLIARCADVADVTAAVNFGRDHKLPIALRSGGHSGPGLGTIDDGLVIDLSLMKGLRVEPHTGTVRVEPGCTTGDVDHATHVFGIAVPFGIISTTGVAGLTLGGGTGYLTRQYGLTIDNLIEADVVLPDGTFVTASSREHSDLFWGLRGGGGNFGIVTSFLFQARSVGMVYAGPLAWPQDYASTIMRAYRDFLPSAPEELGIFLGLKTVPSGSAFPEAFWGHRICLTMACYNGSEDDGKSALAPLLDSLPTPALNWLNMMPYPAVQSMFDPLYPKGMQWYWRGDFVRELTDEAIDEHLVHSGAVPTELSLMHLYPIDGAAHLVGESETAWSARDATWSMVIAGIDPSSAKAAEITRWAKDYWAALHRFNGGGGYSNFMMDDEGEARVKASYGDNYLRLTEVKRRYDPQNLFRSNQNIQPR
jgi:hypothetical protein